MRWREVRSTFCSMQRPALVKRLVEEDGGQNLVEYTVMIGLVVLSIWIGVNAAGIDVSLSTIWSNVRAGVSK